MKYPAYLTGRFKGIGGRELLVIYHHGAAMREYVLLKRSDPQGNVLFVAKALLDLGPTYIPNFAFLFRSYPSRVFGMRDHLYL